MIYIIFLSFILWMFLLWLGTFGLRSNVSWSVRGGGGGGDVSTTTYYKYRVRLGHQNINPNSSIVVYDANGVLTYTIAPNDPNMDYGKGIYTVPGSALNLTIESLSTATYYVSYSTQAIRVDYDNVSFEISNTILPNPLAATVWATFEYWAAFTPQEGVAQMIDGKWDTQLQTLFYAEPPNGYVYSIIDFGTVRTIQALDIVAGFFKPDDILEFDIDFAFTLQYSTDGVDYYNISNETTNVQLKGGESKSFEEEDLGVGFETRYIRIVLENVKKINYSNEKIMVNAGNRQALIDAGIVEASKVTDGDIITLREGIYVVAFAEVSAYSDIIIKSEAKLIPTTVLTSPVSESDDTIYVSSTAGFTVPESGETATAYIDEDATKSFTYTGVTSTSFTGVIVGSGVSGIINEYVTQTVETDTTMYDPSYLLPKLGDRLYKEDKSQGEDLFTQTQLDDLSKDYLQEFYKNHNKIEVDVVYAPHYKVGQTVSVTDSYNGLSAVNYFIESIANNSGNCRLTLARYPA